MKSLACLLLLSPAAFAVSTFTEDFESGINGWRDGTTSPGVIPTLFTTGGPAGTDDSYISYTASNVGGGMGGTALFFRANAGNDASGDAFVGNWLDVNATVSIFTIDVRHNHTGPLDFYIRFSPGGGAGASLATGYTVPANTWTTISFEIEDSNPPFQSYGSGSFSGVFGNMQNFTPGFFTSATIPSLTMDIDNVGITVVPEPSSALLGASALGLAFLRRRRA